MITLYRPSAVAIPSGIGDGGWYLWVVRVSVALVIATLWCSPPTAHASTPDHSRGLIADAPASPASAPQPIAIRIPRLAINALIVELGMDTDGTWQLPEAGAGWYWFTAPPGTVGNAVLVGHFDTWWGGNGVFARLHEARVGDRILITIATDADEPEVLEYVVATSRLLDRADLSSTKPTDDDRLTLITCAGWWSFTFDDYTMRRVVTAVRNE